MSQEPYFVGDEVNASAALQCDREDCMVDGHLFYEVLPYRATIDQIHAAWDRHVNRHAELDGVTQSSWTPDLVPAIQGALRMAINAHGPIDKQWIASAAKRVNSAVWQRLKERA